MRSGFTGRAARGGHSPALCSESPLRTAQRAPVLRGTGRAWLPPEPVLAHQGNAAEPDRFRRYTRDDRALPGGSVLWLPKGSPQEKFGTVCATRRRDSGPGGHAAAAGRGLGFLGAAPVDSKPLREGRPRYENVDPLTFAKDACERLGCARPWESDEPACASLFTPLRRGQAGVLAPRDPLPGGRQQPNETAHLARALELLVARINALPQRPGLAGTDRLAIQQRHRLHIPHGGGQPYLVGIAQLRLRDVGRAVRDA